MIRTKILLSAVLCALILLPLAVVSALTEADERYRQTESIRQAVEHVSTQQTVKQQQEARISQSKREQQKAEQLLQDLTKKKRAIRLQLAEALSEKHLLEKHGITAQSVVDIVRVLDQEKDKLRLLLRTVHVAYVDQSTTAISALLGQALVGETLGERTEKIQRHNTKLQMRENLLAMLQSAQHLPERVAVLRAEHADALAEYHEAQALYDIATQRMHASAVSQAEIQRTVAEVQSQILQMQSELARIDARLRRQAERALIEKGLLSPKEGEYTSGKIVGKPATLLWPVEGRITAGFYDQNYKNYFGVPHKAIDIAVPQGSSVHAAADGVVYLARYGGKTGYSYILIGHQGGTATLYGHMSEMFVQSGQDVHKGQVIGKSGGRPGTIGAGPMTTGAHLHFEVIQQGAHVDPMSVLP